MEWSIGEAEEYPDWRLRRVKSCTYKVGLQWMVVCLFKATLKLNQTSTCSSIPTRAVLARSYYSTPFGSQYRHQGKQRMMPTTALTEWRLRLCIVVQACCLLLC